MSPAAWALVCTLGPSVDGWAQIHTLSSPWVSWLTNQSGEWGREYMITLLGWDLNFMPVWLSTPGAFSGLTGRSEIISTCFPVFSPDPQIPSEAPLPTVQSQSP